MKPLVSVIVPSYNSTSTILRTLDSLNKQTYKNIEIIVVDRESTDETQKISRKFRITRRKTSEQSIIRTIHRMFWSW